MDSNQEPIGSPSEHVVAHEATVTELATKRVKRETVEQRTLAPVTAIAR